MYSGSEIQSPVSSIALIAVGEAFFLVKKWLNHI